MRLKHEVVSRRAKYAKLNDIFEGINDMNILTQYQKSYKNQQSEERTPVNMKRDPLLNLKLNRQNLRFRELYHPPEAHIIMSFIFVVATISFILNKGWPLY